MEYHDVVNFILLLKLYLLMSDLQIPNIRLSDFPKLMLVLYGAANKYLNNEFNHYKLQDKLVIKINPIPCSS